MVLEISGPATLAVQVAPAQGHAVRESLEVRMAGRAVEGRWVTSEHGTRILVLEAMPGIMSSDYTAHVSGPGVPAVTTQADLLRYLRPSRYCESDSLAPTARAQFGGLAGADLLAAVSSWVGTRRTYVPGSSLPTDEAATLQELEISAVADTLPDDDVHELARLT